MVLSRHKIPPREAIPTVLVSGSITVAVTAAADYDLPLTQPANTYLEDLQAVPNSIITTAGNNGDDVDFSLGTAAGGGQIIAATAILADGGGAVTWKADQPIHIVANGSGHAANAFLSAGIATTEAIRLSLATFSATERNIHIRVTPLANDLAAAASKIKFTARFRYSNH